MASDFVGCPNVRGNAPLFLRFRRAGHITTATVMFATDGKCEDSAVTAMVHELRQALNARYDGLTTVEPIYVTNPVTGHYETQLRITSPDDSPATLRRLLSQLVQPAYKAGTSVDMQVTRNSDDIITKVVFMSIQDSLALRNAFKPFVDNPNEDFTVAINDPEPEDVTTVTVEFAPQVTKLKFVHITLNAWLNVYLDVRTVTNADTVPAA